MMQRSSLFAPPSEKAAESKLSHGIIDASDLVKEINSENAAKLQQSIHEIQLLKAIYDLKNTTNN